MKRTAFVLSLISIGITSAAAQEGRTRPPATLKPNAQIESIRPGGEAATAASSYYPPFCPPTTCLYYAGDFESTYSQANGLYNANDGGIPAEAQVWVGVKPDRDATVTGVTFVQDFAEGGVGTNPTPFAVRVGIKPGQAGKTICSTSGTATVSVYGDFPEESYTIKKLSKPCKLRKATVYYVNLLPTFKDNYGYLMNVQPNSPPNHHGWKNELNHCYWNSPSFGVNYVACNGYDGLTFNEFSIALTGKE